MGPGQPGGGGSEAQGGGEYVGGDQVRVTQFCTPVHLYCTGVQVYRWRACGRGSGERYTVMYTCTSVLYRCTGVQVESMWEEIR